MFHIKQSSFNKIIIYKLNITNDLFAEVVIQTCHVLYNVLNRISDINR